MNGTGDRLRIQVRPGVTLFYDRVFATGIEVRGGRALVAVQDIIDALTGLEADRDAVLHLTPEHFAVVSSRPAGRNGSPPARVRMTHIPTGLVADADGRTVALARAGALDQLRNGVINKVIAEAP